MGGSIASSFDGGTGSKDDPYQIANGEQLAYLAKQIDDNVDFTGVYFKLTADILLNDNINDEPIEWNSIGMRKIDDSTSEIPFLGTFDGANHKIIGLYQTGKYAYGLFAYIGCGAELSNLTVTDGNIIPETYDAGVICGYSKGTISNCTNEADISIPTYKSGNIGGVCGFLEDGKIDGCSNKGEVKITFQTERVFSNVGGVCGYNNIPISECYNTGDVSGTTSYVGGLCGINSDYYIKDCYNTGNITGGSSFVGGICGLTSHSTADSVDDISGCYNTGNVLCKDSTNTGYTGGICGRFFGAVFKQCYNTGSVTSGSTPNTGGIIGFADFQPL